MVEQVEELHLADEKTLTAGFGCIDHVYDCLCLLVISVPSAPERLLPAQVPDLQPHVLVRDLLYIATNGRLGHHNLT